MAHCFTWDRDAVAEQADLRLDGSADWSEAARWHFEPSGLRPLVRQTAQSAITHFLSDHLGTPREMFDEDGTLRWAATSTNWGIVRSKRVLSKHKDEDGVAIYAREYGSLALQELTNSAQDDCPIRFRGQWADKETGLSYNRHRHYDPSVGQYASPDPIGLRGGEKPQSYVKIPTTSIDVFGLSATVGDHFAGHSQDTMLHLSHDTQIPTMESNSYWARLGDVKHLTPEEYRIQVVGAGAAGYSPKATTFHYAPKSPVFVLDGTSAFGFPEFVNSGPVNSAGTVTVPQGVRPGW